MKKITFLIFLVNYSVAFSQQIFKKEQSLLGSPFEITVVATDSVQAKLYTDLAILEVKRIENLVSDWIPTTQISQVNQNAGIRPVQVSSEVFNLTKKAIWFSEISAGAFDISMVGLDKIWKFDGSMEQLPSRKQIKQSVANVGYKNIVLDSANSTIFLTKKGMKIGFGSIGKGYAADKGREFLQALGIKAGILNAAGDVATWGTQINGKPWRIGVNNPLETGETLAVLEFSEQNAVTTSGAYEKYVEFHNKRYAHIINPKTGYPTTELLSVTIIGGSAEMCNGFSTSVMVLGLKKGIRLLKKFPDYDYVVVANDGKVVSSFCKAQGD